MAHSGINNAGNVEDSLSVGEDADLFSNANLRDKKFQAMSTVLLNLIMLTSISLDHSTMKKLGEVFGPLC